MKNSLITKILLASTLAFASLSASAAETEAAPKFTRGDFLHRNDRAATFGDNADRLTKLKNWFCKGVETSPKPFPHYLSAELPLPPEASAEMPEKWKAVTVPHDLNRVYPGTTQSPKPYQLAWYKTSFDVSADELRSRTHFLDFEACAYASQLWVNGSLVGSHGGSFTPFSFNITKHLKPGTNIVALRVANDIGKFASYGAQAGKPIPLAHAYGSQWHRGNYRNGLIGEVVLRSSTPVRIEKIKVAPSVHPDSASLAYKAKLAGLPKSGAAKLKIELFNAKKALSSTPVYTATTALKPASAEIAGSFKLPKMPELWGVGKPELYDLVLSVVDNSGNPLCSSFARFGFREFTIENGKFRLNGKPFYAFGQNVHADGYFGWARAEKFDQKAAEECLRFLNDGYNLVRTVHQPIPNRFLDMADECGLPIYHEWAWSFFIDITDEFEANTRKEIVEFADYSHNHASVVAWSLGNEIRVGSSKKVIDILNGLYDLVHDELDLQKRPICSFSGVGARFADLFAPKTDFLDYHTYIGLSEPWGEIWGSFDFVNSKPAERYGKAAADKMPVVAYEMVGYSWGAQTDDDFKPGDRAWYEEVLKRSFNWGAPQVAGFLGCLPASIVTSKGFMDYARDWYGRRIFEETRLDPRIEGFAPWFLSAPNSKLWTQPILPSIRTAKDLPPRNLFSGEKLSLTFKASHPELEALPSGTTLSISLNTKSTKNPIASVKLPASIATKDGISSMPLSLTIPETFSGEYELRLSLTKEGKELGYNSYDIFVQNASLRSRKIAASRPVFILDASAPKNAAALKAVLSEHGVSAKIVPSAGAASDNSLLILPPTLEEKNTFNAAAPELKDFISTRGGIFLALEQPLEDCALPGGQATFKKPANYVEVISIDHPCFKGLSWKQFETWDYTDRGFVSSSYISPFKINYALAIKGPLIGAPGQFGTTVSEALLGKGRVFVSLLNATHARPSDPAAALYFYNLISYLTGPDSALAKAEALGGEKPLFVGDPTKDAAIISLEKHVNAGFSDTKDNDKQGGWTDQGNNDFRAVTPGMHEFRGVPFSIIDPAKNNGLSCARVKGEQRPSFPAAIRGIPVNDKFAQLAFIHTAAWCFSGNAATYKINYADGTSTRFNLRAGVDIGDWWCAKDCPSAPVALVCQTKGGYPAGAYLTLWKNPSPEKQITSIDLLSSQEARAGQNDWEATTDPVVILLAVTGIRSSGIPKASADGEWDILDSKFKRTTAGINGKAGGSLLVENTIDGRVLTLTFKEHAKNADAFAAVIYKTPAAPHQGFNELVFEAKSKTDTPLQVALHEQKWRGQIVREVKIQGNDAWQEIRIPLPQDRINFNKLGDGFYIHHKSWDNATPAVLKEATIQLRKVRLIPNKKLPAGAAAASGPLFPLDKSFIRLANTNPNATVSRTKSDSSYIWNIDFNAHAASDNAFAVLFFKAPKAAKYKTLSFEILSDAAVTAQMAIPQKGWKAQFVHQFTTNGTKTWQKISVPIPPKKIDCSKLDGSVHLKYDSWNKGASFPKVSFKIRNISLQ